MNYYYYFSAQIIIKIQCISIYYCIIRRIDNNNYNTVIVCDDKIYLI